MKAKKVCTKTLENWKRYGDHLSEVNQQSPRDFYKHVNRFRRRDEPYVPTTMIKMIIRSTMGKIDSKLKRTLKICWILQVTTSTA